jgi:hypothetical protein
MAIDSTPLGELLLKKRGGVMSRAENDLLRSEVLGAARKLLLEYPETSKNNPTRSSAENTLVRCVQDKESHRLRHLVLAENANVVPGLRISIRLAIDLHDHGTPANIGEDLAASLEPLLNPRGPNWTVEALENAVDCLSESLWTSLSLREEDEFKWWQPDYLSVPLRRILCIDWQLSDVISALRYCPNELVKPANDGKGIHPNQPTVIIPDKTLLETCGEIRKNISIAINSLDCSDQGAEPDNIFWYFFHSLRGKLDSNRFFSIPRNGIHSYSLIRNLTTNFLKNYYYLAMPDVNDAGFIQKELKKSLKDVAVGALGDLKRKYQKGPTVHHNKVRGNDFDSQLWWMDGGGLSEIKPEPVCCKSDEEFSLCLTKCAPIEPYGRILIGDRRNREDVNHNTVKPRHALELSEFLLRNVRRQFQKRILIEALFDRYEASFNVKYRRSEIRSVTGNSCAPMVKVRNKNRVEDYCELIRIKFDSWYIEFECAKNIPDASAETIHFDYIQNGKSIVEETDRDQLKSSVIDFVLNEIEPNLCSDDFSIVCSYVRNLFEN